MIGYYVHHQGSGHLHRAMTVAPHLPEPVTGISSLPRPEGWAGPWLQLPRDDAAADYGASDVSAAGRLHWVPRDDTGLRERMATLAAWIARHAPTAMVVDLSVEICLLARLHGVPVVAMTAPGRRTDPAHCLGFDVAAAVIGPWPDGWTPRLLPGAPVAEERMHAVGAVSRYAPVPRRVRASRRRPRAVLLAGTGGDGFTAEVVEKARAETPEWDWTVLSRTLGTWHADPSEVLADADVAVLHPGQNSLAEVAALRVPAVVVPAERPFDEQRVTARALEHGWPAVVVDSVPSSGWRELLGEAIGLDGHRWEAWCDGRGPARIADVVAQVAREGPG